MLSKLLLPLTLTTATAAADITDIESVPESETVGVDEDRYDRMTVPVTIDGEPFRFMIDTGAQATVVTQKVTQRLDLAPSGKVIVVGMASSEWADTVELDGLQLGSRVFDGLTAPVLNSTHVGADGIVGLDSLQGLRVLIDFRNDSMTVADVDEKASTRGYEIVVRARQRLGQLIITNAEIDGVEAAVIIDTGAQGSMGNLALRKRLRARKSYEVTSTDVNGFQIAGDLSVAREVEIQDLTLQNIPIAYADAPAFAALGLQDKPALTLGMQHLRMFDRVAIDFEKRRILFDLPRGTRRPQAGDYAKGASRL